MSNLVPSVISLTQKAKSENDFAGIPFKTSRRSFWQIGASLRSPLSDGPGI